MINDSSATPPGGGTEPAEDHAALRDSEARFRQLAENIRQVFYMLDPSSGYVLYLSPAFAEVWGRDPDDAGILESVVAEDRNVVVAAWDRQARGERTEIQYRIARPDGEVRWILDRSFPVHDEAGALTRTVGIAEDITEDKQREQRQQFLAEASRLLSGTLSFTETMRRLTRLVVPRISDWCTIYLAHDDGTLYAFDIVHSDPAKAAVAEELQRRFPPLPSEPTGIYSAFRTGTSHSVRTIDDALLQSWSRNEENLGMLRSLGLYSIMTVPLIARGSTLGVMTFVSAESRRQYDESDVVFAEDLASRAAVAADNARLFETAQSAHAEAERKHNELEAFMESRTRLMRGFSHDLKNPLGAADGHAALLEDGVLGSLSEQQRNSVERIRSGIKNAVALIDDLVELARAEAGQITLRPAELDVNTLVKELAEQHRPAAGQAGLALDRNLGPVKTVMSDPDRIRQVLGNLLSNATKYTRKGGRIEMRTGMRRPPERVAGALAVAIDVEDTGIGIPEDKVPALFTEFERIDPMVKPGAGLGLAISRRIARLLGGEVTVETVRGEGSTFTLWLPLPETAPE